MCVFSTCMLPSVIVPVLSRQSTSTRASVSMLYRSCTSVRLRASLMTPTASAIEVSITSPSGIMPTTEATVPVTASLRESVLVRLLKNINIPSGKIAIETMRMIQLIERISSDFGFLNFFASAISFDEKLSAPTALTLARQSPACTKLPE